MPRVQSILGLLGIHHAVLIIKGESPLFRPAIRGVISGAAASVTQTFAFEFQSSEEHKPWESFPLARVSFSTGLFCTNLLQIQRSPSQGRLQRSRSLSSETVSFPGKWLVCPFKGPHGSQSPVLTSLIKKAFGMLHTPDFTSPSSVNKMPHIRKPHKWQSFLQFLWCLLCEFL